MGHSKNRKNDRRTKTIATNFVGEQLKRGKDRDPIKLKFPELLTYSADFRKIAAIDSHGPDCD